MEHRGTDGRTAASLQVSQSPSPPPLFSQPWGDLVLDGEDDDGRNLEAHPCPVCVPSCLWNICSCRGAPALGLSPSKGQFWLALVFNTEGMCPLGFCFLLPKAMSILEGDAGEWAEGAFSPLKFGNCYLND